MGEKLLQCAHCGGNPKVIEDFYVRCDTCGACTGWRCKESDAEVAWNRRVMPAAAQMSDGELVARAILVLSEQLLEVGCSLSVTSEAGGHPRPSMSGDTAISVELSRRAAARSAT
jgi:hypothetical protein